MTGSGEPPAELVGQDGASIPDRLARLWTPHRMAYIKAEAEVDRDEGGCPFCRIPELDDDAGLVLHRGGHPLAEDKQHPNNPPPHKGQAKPP